MAQETVPDVELRARLRDLVAAKRARRAPSRASVIRQHLIDANAPVRSLLVAVSGLSWQATGEHPVLDALDKLRAQYAAGTKSLPAEVTAPRLGPAWREAIADLDRDRALRALEVATLFALRRALRNGSVWIEHSLSFRGRERLFLPDERWKAEARRHYARLQLPAKASDFLAPLLARVRAGVDAVAAATRAGLLRVDDELHLAPLAADEEDPQVTKLRTRLDQRIGEKWPRLSEQHPPILKWIPCGLPTVQSCPRRRSALATNRPTRWATRGAPGSSSYAAIFICGKPAKYASSGVARSRLE